MAPVGDNEFEKDRVTLGGVDLVLQSYRVGTRWAAKVETADVGNAIGRGSGDTREAAETAALESAKLILDMRSATAAFRTSTSRLKP
jgi:hypothetical protein